MRLKNRIPILFTILFLILSVTQSAFATSSQKHDNNDVFPNLENNTLVNGMQQNGDVVGLSNEVVFENPLSGAKDTTIENDNIDLISKILISLIFSLGISALSMLITLLFPKNSSRITDCFSTSPGIAWGVGLLSLFTILIGMIVTAITIILIPVTVIAFIILIGGVLLGFSSIGFWIGRRIAETSKTEWSEPIAAGIGSIIMSILISSFSLIPNWIGGGISVVLIFVLCMFGLGGVTLTIFGSKPYPRTKSNFPPSLPPFKTSINANLGQSNLTGHSDLTKESRQDSATENANKKQKNNTLKGKSSRKSPASD